MNANPLWSSRGGSLKRKADGLDEAKKAEALKAAQKAKEKAAALRKAAEQKAQQLKNLRHSGSHGSLGRSSSGHGLLRAGSGSLHRTQSAQSAHSAHSASGLSRSHSAHGSLLAKNGSPKEAHPSRSGLHCRKCRQKADPSRAAELKDGYCLKCRQRAKEKAAFLQKAAEKKAAERKAERNRLVPVKPCLERPSYHRNQSALICRKCQQSSNLRRIPDLKDGTFLCPPCRLREMDPFNWMRENEKGLLKLLVLQPPVLPEETAGEATLRIRLNMPNLQKWRKAGEEIDVRMLNLDTCDTLQTWPQSLTMWANGTQAFQVEAPKEGHKRRDAPQRISACLKSEVNELKISMRDGWTLQRFGIAIVRVKPQSVLEMRKAVRLVSPENGRKLVREVLWNSKLLSMSDEVAAEGSDRCRLTCPLTHQRIHTPVRGEKCAHLQCYDLKAYLEINRSISAFNKRWTCPVCAIATKPADMFVDMYMLHILKKTEEDDDEIGFTQDGEWTVTAKLPPPPSPDSDMEPGDDQEETSPDVCVVGVPDSELGPDPELGLDELDEPSLTGSSLPPSPMEEEANAEAAEAAHAEVVTAEAAAELVEEAEADIAAEAADAADEAAEDAATVAAEDEPVAEAVAEIQAAEIQAADIQAEAEAAEAEAEADEWPACVVEAVDAQAEAIAEPDEPAIPDKVEEAMAEADEPAVPVDKVAEAMAEADEPAVPVDKVAEEPKEKPKDTPSQPPAPPAPPAPVISATKALAEAKAKAARAAQWKLAAQELEAKKEELRAALQQQHNLKTAAKKAEAVKKTAEKSAKKAAEKTSKAVKKIDKATGKADKKAVAASDKKADVAAAEKKAVAASDKKADVAAAEKKAVAVSDKKADVAAAEKKAVAVSDKKADVAAAEKKAVAVSDKKADVPAGEKKAVAVSDKKADAAAAEKKAVAVSDKKADVAAAEKKAVAADTVQGKKATAPEKKIAGNVTAKAAAQKGAVTEKVAEKPAEKNGKKANAEAQKLEKPQAQKPKAPTEMAEKKAQKPKAPTEMAEKKAAGATANPLHKANKEKPGKVEKAEVKEPAKEKGDKARAKIVTARVVLKEAEPSSQGSEPEETAAPFWHSDEGESESDGDESEEESSYSEGSSEPRGRKRRSSSESRRPTRRQRHRRRSRSRNPRRRRHRDHRHRRRRGRR